MFCKKCGKELPDESQFCPYCMTKFVEEKEENPIEPTPAKEAPAAAKEKKGGKTPIIIAVVAVILVAIIACAIAIPKIKNAKADGNEVENPGAFTTSANLDAGEKTITKGQKKSVEKDDDLGLMNVKIQDTEGLSNIEKLLVQYFDRDYFAPAYNSLQRYPKVYRGAQISFVGTVEKAIETNDNNYTLLFEYGADSFSKTDNYVVIKGEQKDSRLIEGDIVYIYGKYADIENYTVDGKSYSVPTILVNTYSGVAGMDIMPMYAMQEIREIATYIFGKDFTIKDYAGSEYDPDGIYDMGWGVPSNYVVELENQSNANFTAYSFAAYNGGEIYDLKSDFPEKRAISVSADFNNFYVQIFNQELKTYTIACYDLSLNKLWSRDFDEATSALLDYTASHLYLVVNGYMYIMDTETGEDATAKTFVGEKVGIRKVSDGILLIANPQTNAFMKTDLKGNVLWSVNAKGDMCFGSSFSEGKGYVIDGLSLADRPIVQIVDNNYVIPYETFSMDSAGMTRHNGDYTIVISPDGNVLFEDTIK